MSTRTQSSVKLGTYMRHPSVINGKFLQGGVGSFGSYSVVLKAHNMVSLIKVRLQVNRMKLTWPDIVNESERYRTKEIGEIP